MNIQEIYELYFTAVYRYILALSGNSQIAEDQLLRKRKKEEFPGEETLQSLPEADSLEQVIVEREIAELFGRGESWARVFY